MKTRKADIIIAGGGASGLAAAVAAKREAPDSTVVVVEKNVFPGRKILSTGNGRCNLSNVKCRGRDTVLRFFESLGVITRTDAEGRIYPYTEDAKDVAEALTGEAEQLGVEFLCSASVDACSFNADAGTYSVTIKTAAGGLVLEAERFLLATGGKAAPKLGTTGDGYRLAKSLYHTVTKLAPALTAVETREDVSDLAGMRAKAKVSLLYGGGSMAEEEGEVQFTKYGISGICVFDLSRYMTIPEGRTLINGFDDYSIEIDFMPGVRDVRTLVESGARIVKAPVRKHIEKLTGGDPEMTAWMVQHFLLHPAGLRGWDHAEITKGGVPLKEIDPETMASKFMPGLYFAGEITDFDGPAGGFNLEYAWETGIRAGHAMAEAYSREKEKRPDGKNE